MNAHQSLAPHDQCVGPVFLESDLPYLSDLPSLVAQTPDPIPSPACIHQDPYTPGSIQNRVHTNQCPHTPGLFSTYPHNHHLHTPSQGSSFILYATQPENGQIYSIMPLTITLSPCGLFRQSVSSHCLPETLTYPSCNISPV